MNTKWRSNDAHSSYRTRTILKRADAIIHKKKYRENVFYKKEKAEKNWETKKKRKLKKKKKKRKKENM